MKSKILISIGLGLCMLGGCECPKNPMGPSNDTSSPAPAPAPTTPPVYSDASVKTFTLNPSASAGVVGTPITFTASYTLATTINFNINPTITSTTGQTNQLYVLVGYNGIVRGGIGFIPTTGIVETVCYVFSSTTPFQTWTSYGVMTPNSSSGNDVQINIGASSGGGMTSVFLKGSQIGYNNTGPSSTYIPNSASIPASGWFVVAYSSTGGDSTGASMSINNLVVTQ